MNRGSRDKWVLFSPLQKSSVYEMVVRLSGAARKTRKAAQLCSSLPSGNWLRKRFRKNPECGNGKFAVEEMAVSATLSEVLSGLPGCVPREAL
jgi:hypothetical protein